MGFAALHPSYDCCRPQGEAVAYLCQGGQCGAPLVDLEAFRAELSSTS